MVTVIAAYYDGALPLRFEEVALNRWRQDVEDLIVWIEASAEGQEPWGTPGLIYRMRYIAADNYYYERSQGRHHFGVFDDDAGNERHFVWTDDGPERIASYSPDSRNVKRGVLMSDEDAEEVGIAP